MRKHFLFHLLTVVVTLLLAGCSEKEKEILVESIALSQPSAEMEIGETLTLKATVSPSNASYDGLNWTSTNPKVASVSTSGLVTALSEGNTIITVMAGGKTASCAITVVKGFVAVTSISLNKTSLEMVEGDSETLIALVLPDDATDKNVTWTSSDESVVTVENGLVSAISSGIATIKAKAGELTASCSISVMQGGNIVFADPIAKTLCVENWDTDGDGELSYKEAAFVASIDKVFYRSHISSFDEFQYFTGIDSLKYYAFAQCGQLQSITIPQSISSIEWGAFVLCSSLQRISVTENNPFYSSIDGVLFNEDLTELTCYPPQKEGSVYEVPSSVRVIAECGFWLCGFLESIVLHDEITSMDDAFSLCTSLKSVAIPRGVTRIGDYTFTDCSSLSEVVFHNNLISIGQQAFSGCKSIKEINLPNGVSEIGNSAFALCSSLSSVRLPNTLQIIGAGSFSSCISLQSISFPMGLQAVGNGAFSDCSSLQSIKLPDSLTTIGSNVFGGCTSLTSAVLPVNLTSIGEAVFSGCSNLTSITIPNSLKAISVSLFSNCSSLSSVSIPDSVSSIGSSSFLGCTSLTSLTIPESVTIIEGQAFRGCINLSDLNIPQGVTSIGDHAFQNCSSLTSLVLPKGLTSIEWGTFMGCTNLSSISIPEGVKSIVNDAFYNCYGLTNLHLPESVESIGEWAFGNCLHLPNVIIPQGVKSIGGSAFSGCYNLKSITALPPIPPSGGIDMFWSTVCPIYVPIGSMDAYKSAEYWCDYADRIEAISQ